MWKSEMTTMEAAGAQSGRRSRQGPLFPVGLFVSGTVISASWKYLEHLGTPWSTLEHLGTSWNTLELFGTCWNKLEHLGTSWNLLEPWNMLAHLGTCWNILGTLFLLGRPLSKPSNILPHSKPSKRHYGHHPITTLPDIEIGHSGLVRQPAKRDHSHPSAAYVAHHASSGRKQPAWAIPTELESLPPERAPFCSEWGQETPFARSQTTPLGPWTMITRHCRVAARLAQMKPELCVSLGVCALGVEQTPSLYVNAPFPREIRPARLFVPLGIGAR